MEKQRIGACFGKKNPQITNPDRLVVGSSVYFRPKALTADASAFINIQKENTSVDPVMLKDEQISNVDKPQDANAEKSVEEDKPLINENVASEEKSPNEEKAASVEKSITEEKVTSEEKPVSEEKAFSKENPASEEKVD